MFDRNKLEEQYALGSRKFFNIDLQKADLENAFFSRVDMKQANLNYANFKNADLSDANLTESSLISTEFYKAHLSGINLSKADLTQTNFTQSILNQANFTQACLKKACLIGTVLIEADLSGADLSGADLSGANLSRANFKDSIYDGDTNFPTDFDPKSRGMINKFGIEDSIERFNYLCKCSSKYLGNTMTAKYFNSSRPDFDWFKLFTIDKSSKIIFQGNPREPLTRKQLELFQQWMNSFIKSCSSIVKGFGQMI